MYDFVKYNLYFKTKIHHITYYIIKSVLNIMKVIINLKSKFITVYYSLLFFKIKFGKFVRLLIFQIDCDKVQQPIIISEVNSFKMNINI